MPGTSPRRPPLAPWEALGFLVFGSCFGNWAWPRRPQPLESGEKADLLRVPANSLTVLTSRPRSEPRAPMCEDPQQPHESVCLLLTVVVLCRKKQESPASKGLGGEAYTLIENSWGGWGGTTC